MAFEGLLRAWSNERIPYRDASHCVADKLAGIACAARAAREGFEDTLEARLERHGLGVVRVLSHVPARASGATLLSFGDGAGASPGAEGPLGESPPGESPPGDDASTELPAALDFMELVVGVDGCRLPPSGALGATPGHKPPLEYRVERRQDTRALLRITSRLSVAGALAVLRRAGQHVVGDEASDAPAATRLMLHVSALRGRVNADAPLPAELESWLAGRAVPPPERFASALRDAGIARFQLAAEHGALRLIGEEAGEISGVTVERYGAFAVLSVSTPEAARREIELSDCLMDHGAQGVYVKRRSRTDLRGKDADALAPPLPLRGDAAPPSLELRTAGLVVEVNLGDGLATGLFLDQRANWARVRGFASGGAFLNLFCYTGAFTLAAAAGGAATTTSVDLAGRALTRLGRNLELNQLSGAAHRLLKADVPSWLARARRAERRYDCIVLDPPSFGTRARGVLSTRRDNPELLEGALGLLQPGGRLIAVSHHRQISSRELCDQVAQACASLGRTAQVEPLVGGWDCPSLPGVSGTKSVLARLT